MNISVKTSSSSYDIIIKNGIFEEISEHIKDIVSENFVFVITDDTVNGLYGGKLKSMLSEAGVKHTVMVLPSGEKTKSLESLFAIYKEMAKNKLTRSDYVIAFGGGVIGDLAGFAAATFLRGIKLIQIPTTLLSQVDSSVGGKVAVNLDEGKNLVGNFYPPCKVLIDPILLNTLPERVFNDGMAEVIKYGAIRDKKLFDILETENIDDLLETVITTCVGIKKDIVERDEFDTGERMLLNFGHTYGHVVENFYNYEKYTHGEGVAIGMLKITDKTEKMGVTKSGTYDRIYNVIKKYDLLFENVVIDKDKAKEILFLDKKSSSKDLKYVVLERIGKAKIIKFDKDNTFILD